MKKDKLVQQFDSLDSNSNLNDIQNYIIEMMETNGFNNTPLELFCYFN